MAGPAIPQNYAVPSIQTVYTLYADKDREGIHIHCKNVIKIPIAEPVARKINIDTYTVTPCIAYVFANDITIPLKVFIETNEGVTVEPIIVPDTLVQYNRAYLLTLPRGTTGIKKAYIRWVNGVRIIQNDLVFDIMEAPYDYENYLPALNHAEFLRYRDSTDEHINELYTGFVNLDGDVANLKSRVTALENKAGG